LNDEEEDGTTLVHRMFDQAFVKAIEDGSEYVEEISATPSDTSETKGTP